MFGIGGKLAMGMGVALLVVGGVFWMYYNSSQKEIKQLVTNNATLIANVATLKGKVEEQNRSILRLEETRQVDQQSILDLSQSFNEARNEVSKLRETFSSHDFGGLSMAKPGLIERVINKGTAAEGREFIQLTTPRDETISPVETEENE